MIFPSQKAMSPLIATVLLIAFAVALGAMIMNWSADAVNDPSVDLDAACESVKLVNNGNICYSDGKLNFNFKNIGSTRIEGIKLISDSEIGVLELNIKDSSMINGETLVRTMPFIYNGGDISLEFYPQVLYEENLVQCTGLAFDRLPSC